MFESKINRGRANGYAPLDGSGKVPLDKLPPIQSTINTGSFATTGSNIFTGNQIISGSDDNSLTIGEVNTIAGPSFGLRVSGSDGAPLFLTSDGTLLIGAMTNPTDLSGDASFFANQLISFPISDGPTAGILVQKSGSFQSNWVFDYDGKSYFPGDITIGYNSLGSGLTSGSLNITKGNIVLSGSFAQQVNYAPLGSGSFEETPATEVTELDITKDIHLIDITGIEGDSHYYLPNGLYDGQVVRLALKGDDIASPNNVYVWVYSLRTSWGAGTQFVDWLPFSLDVDGNGRSLATAVYIDGSWNIDNSFFGMWEL
jgi:hypothetical protein